MNIENLRFFTHGWVLIDIDGEQPIQRVFALRRNSSHPCGDGADSGPSN